jgi:hypothetical protein
MGRVIWAIALALLLTACGTMGVKLPNDLVEQAIALQLNQTQQQLNQQLRLDLQPEIGIRRIKIAEKNPLQIQQLQAYQVKGTCDYTIKLPKRDITQRQTPFEVYLQRQKEGKTWRLAFIKTTENGEPIWATQRIPTDTF